MWQELKEEIYERLEHRNKQIEEYVHKELTGVAMMKEVTEMFKPVASKIDQTELRKAIL